MVQQAMARERPVSSHHGFLSAAWPVALSSSAMPAPLAFRDTIVTTNTYSLHDPACRALRVFFHIDATEVNKATSHKTPG